MKQGEHIKLHGDDAKWLARWLETAFPKQVKRIASTELVVLRPSYDLSREITMIRQTGRDQ